MFNIAEMDVNLQLSKLSIGGGFSESESPLSSHALTKSQKKNLKKKEKKKGPQAPAFEIEEVISSPKSISDVKLESLTVEKPHKSVTLPEHPGEPEDVDKLRLTRALRKKLKQIAELEVRIASGDIKKPDQGQIDKIAKKSEYEQELALLEL